MANHIGKYEILRMLGEGAMGKVYLGRDPSLGREVAIKTIRPDSTMGEDARQRFDREARAAGALNHPNLVTIHEFGEDGGTLYIAMEYLPGEDLQALLRQNRLSPPEILEVIAQVCDGLAYAHARGVMHRDIKPSNVQVSREMGRLHAKVMDFGIARISGSDMTGTGTLLGTFGYMAPEYIQSGIPDSRSDLFAAGVMLYEALCGQRPFNGDTTATLLYRIIHEQPKPLEPACLQGISPKVASILRRALAKDPSRRFQNAQEMAAALRGAKDPTWQGLHDQEGATTLLSERPELPPEAPASTKSRSWKVAWLTGAGVLILGAGLEFAWSRRASAKPQPVSQAVVFPDPSPVPAPIPIAPEPPPTKPAEAKPVKPVEAVLAKPAAQVKPAPASALSAPPVAPPPKNNTELLDGAEQVLGTDARAALTTCQKVLMEDPDSVRAHALEVVALYRMERYGPMAGAMKEARQRGIMPRQMMRLASFAEMMAEEQRERRIPEGLWKHLFLKGGPDRPERPRRLPLGRSVPSN